MYQRILRQTLTQPPGITWRKIIRRTRTAINRTIDRRRAYRSHPALSDGEFLRALGGRFSSVEAYLEQMATRSTPRFFLSPAARPERVAALRTLCPASEATTVAAADKVCAHIFDLLGSGPTGLGSQIDWHSDFKSGHRWDPRIYYADIRPAPYPGGYDLKVPWELSRCQHFAWLGQAYWFSDDEKYTREFVAQVTDWITQNPPQLGVNWACAMDVAIRAVNWLWGYYFFQNSPSLNDDFRLAFYKSLLQHGRHIYANLEYSETLTSNHYLSDIVGLVYLGILLPEFSEAQKWRTFGLQELEKEMFKQVYPDGVDFEASVSYHRLVAELFLSATLLAQLNGHRFSAPYLARLEKMVEFTLHITRADGSVPLIGDCDNGRLHRLKAWGGSLQEWSDHRHLLAVGASLFGRQDFAQAAGDQWEEALWLCGAAAVEATRSAADAMPAATTLSSRRFPDAGIFVLRHDDMHIVVSAGPAGQNGNGGHAHNDIGSFTFFGGGVAWIVDPGTYLYTADYEARNRFRSTAVHNTVMVDGQEQRPFKSEELFRLANDPPVDVLQWSSDLTQDCLIIEHSGYALYNGVNNGVTHRRELIFDKGVGFLVIRDQLRTSSAPCMSVSLHFAQDVAVQMVSDRQAIARHPASPVALLLTWRPVAPGALQIGEGAVSPGYGVQVKCQRIIWVQQGTQAEMELKLAALQPFG
ncbi:MAG: hypothetical protein DCC55_20745 [Chloroflexi bacterium]|nr:MAG: hypothetical protein DCC55_20745 [Chloroflexota bacterium]